MKVIGHRGAAQYAPENTAAGFDLAIRMGVDAIETDVQKTKDGKLVLFHDDRVDRTTNGTGVLQQMTWRELRTLDAGSWFHPLYAKQKIMLLPELLDQYAPRIPIDLEVKQPGIEEEVVTLVQEYDIFDAITFTSANFETAKRIKELAPESTVGLLTWDISEENVDQAIRAGITQFSPEAQQATNSLVERWHDKGLFVRPWGVFDETIMRNAITAGVDGMTVDFPDKLLNEFGRGEQAREALLEIEIKSRRGKEK